MFENVT